MVVGPPFENPVSLGRCALVADDDASMRDVLRTVLTGAGYTVLLAATGREALSLAANLDAVVAIIDLAMPDGDGRETCLGLRNIPRWRNVPILVLSHYHTEKALKAALRAGANGFVCKPFVPAELLQHIAGYVAKPATADPGQAKPTMPDPRREQEPASAGPPRSPGEHASLDQQRAVLDVYRGLDDEPCGGADQPLVRHDGRPRILVGVDDAQTREIIHKTLDDAGYLTSVVRSGKEAISQFVLNRFDLVLIDVMMPDMSGFETGYMIRSLTGDKGKTPIVALTASSTHLFGQDLRDAGMNGFLLKPVTPAALLKCLGYRLGERTPVKSIRQRGETALAPDLNSLDRIAKMFPAGAMARFLENLVLSVEEVFPRLNDGWLVEEPVELMRRLHGIAGTAATLGCIALSD